MKQRAHGVVRWGACPANGTLWARHQALPHPSAPPCGMVGRNWNGACNGDDSYGFAGAASW